MENLFTLISKIVIPSAVGTFVAQDVFNGASDESPLTTKVFRRRFLTGMGKIERMSGAKTLYCYELRRPAYDDDILNEFGSELRIETALFEVIALINTQKHGYRTPLLTDGDTNIFYIRDQTGDLGAVGLSLGPTRWRFDVCPIRHPYEWLSGYRLFSRSRLTVEQSADENETESVNIPFSVLSPI